MMWTNEAGTVIYNKEGNEYFEGTPGDLIKHLKAWEVVSITDRSTRVGMSCGPDCLHREGCFTYRSFYPIVRVRDDRLNKTVTTPPDYSEGYWPEAMTSAS